MAEELEKGTVLPDGAVPANEGQITHRSKYGRGGLHTGDSYPDYQAVLQLPVGRREWGMEVKTWDGGRYELVKNLNSNELGDNANWRPVALGGTAVPAPFPFTNLAIVTVTHNLGRFVEAQVYNTSGQLIEGQVTQVSLNTLEIQFSQSLSGTVVLR